MSESRGFVIAVTSGKGGPGKTTTSQNLACEFARQGFTVSILDADGQGSAAKWGARRTDQIEQGAELPIITIKQIKGDIRQSILDESKLYNIVFIDVAGRASQELTQALMMADLVLVPGLAGIKDLEQLPFIAQELIDTSYKAAEHRRTLGFLNRVDRQTNNQEIIQDKKVFSHDAMQGQIKPLNTWLNSYTKAYDRADRLGAGVIEDVSLGTSTKNKAKAQVQYLAKVILDEINTIYADINKEAAS